jgi:alpha-ketoglutarate-dependent taurine dioxygenase
VHVTSLTPKGDALQVHWRAPPPQSPNANQIMSSSSAAAPASSSFCTSWLRAHGSDVTPQQPASAVKADALPGDGARGTLGVRRLRFDDLMNGGEAMRWEWLSAIAKDGATILEGVPRMVSSAALSAAAAATSTGSGGGSLGGSGASVASSVAYSGASSGASVDGVRFVAELIGPMQPNIYGHIFDVVSQGDSAINLAYTNEAIGPHMDLCYYESPPGLQLLHCLRFDSDVVGGESLLIDAFAAAEELRRTHPEAFETLCTVPATFLKDHSQRANPVLLSYQRPHLAVDPRTRRLTGVFWSPPFEGPLRGVPPKVVGAYYDAYRRLHAAIEASPRAELRLNEGDMLVFNNRRMLHGRAAFAGGADGARHLRGGYVNIDEFANAYNLLKRAHGRGAVAVAQAQALLGNQDWATEPIELPRRYG